MIRLLAPTTTASADDGATVIVEMDAATFRTLAACVEVALDGNDDVDPDDELWDFFAKGKEVT